MTLFLFLLLWRSVALAELLVRIGAKTTVTGEFGTPLRSRCGPVRLDSFNDGVVVVGAQMATTVPRPMRRLSCPCCGWICGLGDMPRKAVLGLQRLLKDEEGGERQDETRPAGNQAKFSFGGMEFVTELIEGRSPSTTVRESRKSQKVIEAEAAAHRRVGGVVFAMS